MRHTTAVAGSIPCPFRNEQPADVIFYARVIRTVLSVASNFIGGAGVFLPSRDNDNGSLQLSLLS